MKYFCHPAIKEWLDLSKVREKYLKSNIGLTFISSFQSQQKEVHYGLQEAVKFRLAHPSFNPIIILSFSSLEVLKQADTFGILSLKGTEYLQLPVPIEMLYETIESSNEKYKDFELSIPEPEWEQFSIPAYKQLLKSVVSKLKHGNHDALGNTALNPLRTACCLSFPNCQPLVKDELEKLRHYLSQGVTAEFIRLSTLASVCNDAYLQNALAVSKQLTELATCTCNSQAEVKQLITRIDEIWETWSKLENSINSNK